MYRNNKPKLFITILILLFLFLGVTPTSYNYHKGNITSYDNLPIDVKSNLVQ